MVDKEIRAKLEEYLNDLITNGEKYRETMVKQIEAYDNEVAAAKKALGDFDIKIIMMKTFLAYVRKSK